MDDAELVGRVLEASYPELMAPAYDAGLLARALPLMTRANPRLLSSGTYYIAEVDDEAAGCGGWTPERPAIGTVEEGLGHLRHFAVHARHVRRGVGRALYEACEASARAFGITRFECQSNLNAEPFYRSLGFERIERIEVPILPDVAVPALLMVRTL